MLSVRYVQENFGFAAYILHQTLAMMAPIREIARSTFHYDHCANALSNLAIARKFCNNLDD